MNAASALPADRFLETLDVVAREGQHLIYSWQGLFAQPVDANWVRGLDDRPDIAERLEAFVSRFGRMQDTIADKVLPRWLMALAETPGSQIETLNRAERLGVVQDVERWLQARALRKRLVHEYLKDADAFAEDLVLAREYNRLLVDCFIRLCEFAGARMGLDETRLPQPLALPPMFPEKGSEDE